MAIYHLSAKPVQRSKGHSIVAKIAYRMGEKGEKIKDDRTGTTHDYTKKKGVLHAEIMTPRGVAKPSRADLWNWAELAEKRKDGCTGKEYEFNLPHELDHDDRVQICRDMGDWLANKYHIAIDFAIHEPNKKGDQRNYHCHMMTTTRKITKDGLGEKADLEKAGRKRKDDLKEIRATFAQITNYYLAQKGIDERIDHRSYKEQGIDQKATIKQGWQITQLEREGVKTYVGDINRDIKERNKRIARLVKLENSQLDRIELGQLKQQSYSDIIKTEQSCHDLKTVLYQKAELELISVTEKNLYAYATGVIHATEAMRADGTLEAKRQAEFAEQLAQEQVEQQRIAERQTIANQSATLLGLKQQAKLGASGKQQLQQFSDRQLHLAINDFADKISDIERLAQSQLLSDEQKDNYLNMQSILVYAQSLKDEREQQRSQIAQRPIAPTPRPTNRPERVVQPVRPAAPQPVAQVEVTPVNEPKHEIDNNAAINLKTLKNVIDAMPDGAKKQQALEHFNSLNPTAEQQAKLPKIMVNKAPDIQIQTAQSKGKKSDLDR